MVVVSQSWGPSDYGQGLMQDITVKVHMWEPDLHPHQSCLKLSQDASRKEIRFSRYPTDILKLLLWGQPSAHLLNLAFRSPDSPDLLVPVSVLALTSSFFVLRVSSPCAHP